MKMKPDKLLNRPGRLLLLFLEPKSLTLENTLSRLGFSQLPLVLLGLLTQRQALVFSRSLACRFCRMRELAIAAAIASLAALRGGDKNFLGKQSPPLNPHTLSHTPGWILTGKKRVQRQ